ncbi:MAG TPA: HAD-IIA family hydrolase [Nocardioidaceae bacterium]|nr:HAD-IIA family hydrolase [Nocardioidaceae bacterium]
MLETSPGPLWETYDVALIDLDGVVYVGSEPVPGAADQLAGAAAAGMRVLFVTNNASRLPSTVAVHLNALGVSAGADDVVTSAQAAARLLADRLPRGASVFVIGGAGLFQALAERGLRPVQTVDEQVAAVVSGYHPDLTWSTISKGAMLVRGGLPWVAANTDATLPLPTGEGPGNGALVDVVRTFAGRDPEVAGKPKLPLFEEALRRTGSRPERALMVGDRLETDIEGAASAGLDSLLVLTGVTGVEELLAAPRRMRPTYLAPDLAGLGTAHECPDVQQLDGGLSGRLAGWTAYVEDGGLRVDGDGTPAQWWQLVAAVGWRHFDDTGCPVDLTGAPPQVA